MEGSTQLSVLLTRLKNYLPLAGGTMTGDLNLGANKLKTTNLLLKEGSASAFYLRNAADTAYVGMILTEIDVRSQLLCNLDGFAIRAKTLDGNYAIFTARESGVGNVEVARFVGAADPYWQMTRAMRLNPITTLPAVEGMLCYHDTEKCLKYRNDAGEVYPGHEIHRRGILADFLANQATGDSATQSNLNDNNTATVNTFDTINKYSEVDFGKVVRLTQFRYFGDANMNADGIWKIQYWNNVTGAWTDWVTGKATNVAAWSGWDSTGGEILTDMIRWVATTLDSFGDSRIGELEVIY